ncbi:MAG: hypothetical protein XD95_0630 [Microgenomates bacterium 39_7]|nr:MAG: hypothetical protein XD95_0630 [Microgenomates bacterium 39_7]
MILKFLVLLLLSLLKTWFLYQAIPRIVPSFIELSPISFPQKAFATNESSAQLIFQDDFEQGLSQWQQVRGNSVHWSVTANKRLEATVPTANTITEIVPKYQLWHSSWKNYRFEFKLQAFSQADINLVWGFQDINNWYELHFYGDLAHLVRLKNNEVVFHRTQLYSLPRNVEHQVSIHFNKGSIRVWVGNYLVIDHQDPTYESNPGKVSFKATTGAAYPTRVQFDQVRVYNFDSFDSPYLNVSSYKQYQQPWRDNEYDHALDWMRWGNWRDLNPGQPPKQTTMYHWGCAVTSLAMVMNYHQLNLLPSGDKLDPGSLNKWLRAEADGYLGEGSINWLAGTRLSKLISDKYSSSGHQLPKLEYHRFYSGLLDNLKSIIDQDRPSIIQVPGHFLVGQGYLTDDNNQTDFYISDPAYNYTLLSQHSQPVVSLIDLQPTNSDLSYMMMVYPSDLQLQLTESSLGEIADTFLAQDTLTNPFYDYDGCLEQVGGSNDLYGCTYHQSMPITEYFSKPESGAYQLAVSNSSQEIQLLQLYLYDQQAQVKMMDRYIAPTSQEQQPKTIDVSFNKTDVFQSEVESQSSPDFSLFFDLLNDFYSQGEIPGELYLALMPIFSWTQGDLDAVAQDRYQQLILQYLSEAPHRLSEEITSQLASLL